MNDSPWQQATLIENRRETELASTFQFRLSTAARHRPGQHYVIRLRAPDGYTASRSYSVASAPDDSGEIELTIELLPGDRFELRGPIGGWFVLDEVTPALLIGGGSGVVPLMSMPRHARRLGRADRLHLVVSVRSMDDLLYAGEIRGSETTVITTRAAAAGSPRRPARLGRSDLPSVAKGMTVFICGSNGFADAATSLVIDAGIAPAQIRVERFGATG